MLVVATAATTNLAMEGMRFIMGPRCGKSPPRTSKASASRPGAALVRAALRAGEIPLRVTRHPRNVTVSTTTYHTHTNMYGTLAHCVEQFFNPYRKIHVTDRPSFIFGSRLARFGGSAPCGAHLCSSGAGLRDKRGWRKHLGPRY